MEKIINISNYSNTLTNFKMIDGLTPDIVKRKYIWLLNAIVEDAIIGEDDYGLVWYSGNWLAGEWEDGTWYSGIWYDGEWKNGKFYSYKFDTNELLQRFKRILEKDNPIHSQFLHGIWRRGEFYNGFFGPQFFMEDWEPISYVEVIYHDIRWESGTFYNGIFRNAAWMQSNTLKSNFQNGVFYNSQWIDGTFSNGTFQGYKWWNGNFVGGDFVLGEWVTGKFNQANPNIKSRFGSMPLTGATSLAGTIVTWRDGQFLNGEFHSGLNIVSGMTTVSNNHNRTWWMGGTWSNGTWYGGTHVSGNFNNGYWYEGFWQDGTFNNGYWYNGFWANGTINNGFFIQGLFKTVNFVNGQLGYQPPQYLLDREIIARSGLTIAPKILGFLPTVTTSLLSGITTTTVICGGNVIEGGDTCLERGVCWDISLNPTLKDDNHTVDGNGFGGFVSYVTGLSPGTFYYIRAYAINDAGLSFGKQLTFATQW